MAKTDFFRVAVEGATVDGRTIERKHITEMVESYAPATYTARINCEHLRGYSPNPPFNAYGSVAALKAEEITIKLGGKDVTRLALYASFEVNDQAKELTAADQKIFSSVEIQPNFAGTGKAYLVGIAFTDSPASLATEVLKFSTREEAKKDHLLGVDDAGFTISFADEGGSADEITAAMPFIKKLFSAFSGSGTEVQKPAVDPKQPETPDQFAELAGAMGEGFDKMVNAFSAATAKQDARIAKLSQDLTALKGDLEKTPDRRNHSQRPTATGGGDRILADC